MQTAFKWLMLANALFAFSASASAQNIDFGKAEYQSGCASCHGIDAKGKVMGQSARN
jgi:mono/diheme cytochrome c family protein